MTSPSFRKAILRSKVRSFALFLLVLMTIRAAQAQTFTVLHSFSGPDGYGPEAGLTLDAAGNLYGTTTHGGSQNCGDGGCGTVFKLTHHPSGWILTTLYEFQGGADGAWPRAGVVFGPDGSLYGTTEYGYGAVFNLRPSTNFCRSVTCPWTLTVLHSFTNGADGNTPGYGNLVFDQQGSVYGTTEGGGTFGAGTVFELTHSSGGWSKTVLYNFLTDQSIECSPLGGVIFDGAGNLWGATIGCGGQYGAVYKLSRSGPGWTATLVHQFLDTPYGSTPDGAFPLSSLTLDSTGNIYGTTESGPPAPTCPGLGTVFEINTAGQFSTLHFFPSGSGPECMYESGLLGPVSLDAQGNLYGTQYAEAYGDYGGVYKGGSQGWSELENFPQDSGGLPRGNVAFDANGNIYGTTSLNGPGSGGGVWEITP